MENSLAQVKIPDDVEILEMKITKEIIPEG